jgi:GT2 family glycosyltransferase
VARDTDAAAAPAIALVIATRDRADRLLRLLDALAEQRDAPSFEVVVVDDGSADGTVSRVEAHAAGLPFRVHVLRQEQSTGPAGARNRGWRSTSADVVVFTDDDCVPAPGWLRELVGTLERDRADLVAGVTTYPAEQADLRGTWAYWMEDDGRGGHYSTSNVAYRRRVLEAVEGFDADGFSHRTRRPDRGPRCINGEDTDLAWRAIGAGYRSAVAPEAVVYHDVFPLAWRESVRNVPRLAGLVLLIKKHPHLRAHFGKELAYRTEDVAALAVLACMSGLASRRWRPFAAAGVLVAGAWYVRLFHRFRLPPEEPGGYLIAVPLGWASDAYAGLVMLRASLRYRTLLL